MLKGLQISSYITELGREKLHGTGMHAHTDNVGQWKKIEDLNMNAYECSHLMFDRDAKIHTAKKVSLINGAEKARCPQVEDELISIPILPCTKYFSNGPQK